MKASTEAAKIISDNISNDKGTQSDAILEMIQSEVFHALMNLEEIKEEDDPMKRLAALSFVGKNISPLIGASINLKKYQAEIKARAEAAAKEVDTLVKKGGLSDHCINGKPHRNRPHARRVVTISAKMVR